MSYELAFADDEVYFLGTLQDWGDFLAWVETLEDATYPDLHHLCNFGWDDGLDAVHDQIRHALEVHPPTVRGVAETAGLLIDRFADREDGAWAVVTDGANGDENGEDGGNSGDEDDEDEVKSHIDLLPDSFFALFDATGDWLDPGYKAFNPSQRRDANGRWTSGAAGGTANPVGATGPSSPRAARRRARARQRSQSQSRSRSKFGPRSKRKHGQGTRKQRDQLAAHIREARSRLKGNRAGTAKLRDQVRDLKRRRDTAGQRTRWSLDQGRAKPAAAPKPTPKPSVAKPTPKPVAKPPAVKPAAAKPTAPSTKPSTPKPPAKPPAPKPTPADWTPTPDAAFRSFPETNAGVAAMDNFGHRASDAWAKSLSPAEADAVRLYGKDTYGAVNGLLRGKTWKQINADPHIHMPGDLTESQTRTLMEHTRTALDRSKIPEPVTLWRGIKYRDRLGIGDLSKIKPGTTFTEKGFVSTSLDPQVAVQFAGPGSYFTNNVVMKIHAPKGTKGAYLNSGGLATYKEAREMALAPDTSYRYVRREKIESYGRTVDVMVVEVVQ